jgi:hypothetical protein
VHSMAIVIPEPLIRDSFRRAAGLGQIGQYFSRPTQRLHLLPAELERIGSHKRFAAMSRMRCWT